MSIKTIVVDFSDEKEKRFLNIKYEIVSADETNIMSLEVERKAKHGKFGVYERLDSFEELDFLFVNKLLEISVVRNRPMLGPSDQVFRIIAREERDIEP